MPLIPLQFTSFFFSTIKVAFSEVMDLPLWEPSDGQVSSNYHVGDVRQCGHYSVVGRLQTRAATILEIIGCVTFLLVMGVANMIEEDALNEKSCVQVLRILMDKADEEIVKLEEEIVMLQCQLAWDDEDWSKPCSAALREKIDHLEILIQSLKKEITDDVHYFGVQLEQPEKLAQRLHDLVKPLLENYFLVKSKQKYFSFNRFSEFISSNRKQCHADVCPSC
ncbi:hypothetical protein Pfo_028357 [Paulownia fortunei]|nr:hypothetical protein Pfo_028357 [Paulownia fortunei]